MAMWNRFKRMVRSNVNRLKADPDPLVRGVGGSLSKLDENLVTLKAHLRVLETQVERLRRREVELDALVQASEAHGATTKAITHQTELFEVRRQLASKEADLTQTQSALERAMAVKAAYREVTDDAKTTPVSQPGAEPAATASPPPAAPRAATPEEVEAWEAEASPPADPSIQIRVQPRGSKKTIGEGDSGPVSALNLEESREIASKTLGEQASLPAAQPASGESLLDELEKLGKLRESGALTDEEFARAKRRLLGG
ncbi:MAG: SHOCT domain-containing protein [Planctomycetes bacterium]|nr:SHOCT domain-containing protein [Planctomycetota bacterium]